MAFDKAFRPDTIRLPEAADDIIFTDSENLIEISS